jgi:phosphoribosylanthranilate isomerase
MIQVKICGVLRIKDARDAFHLGASAVGVNFAPESPRFIGGIDAAESLVRSANIPISFAGVFVNAEESRILEIVRRCGLSIVQLHGDETPEFATGLRALLPKSVAIWKAFPVATKDDLTAIDSYPCDIALLDAKVSGARGGTGTAFDWTILENAPRTKQWALAGGLKPQNVAEAVRRVKPDWVDTASGVESAPGVKDRAKMDAFIRGARP